MSYNVIMACGMTVVIIIGGIDLSVGAVLAFSSFIMADVMSRTNLALGLLAGIYFYVSRIKGVNFAGVLALFSGVVGSLVLSMVSEALSQWTWFTGAIIAYIAYLVLYNTWYGAHHPAVPN